ncbi:MAG: PAS domain S-box protein [Candidatus Hodarchaeales archaeon]
MLIKDNKVIKSDLSYEERFNAIFEKSNIGFELYNTDGLLTDVNSACLEIFGISSLEEVKGFDLFEDPNLSDESKEKIKAGEVVGYESIFDFEKVKQADLYKTSHSGTIHLEYQISTILSQDESSIKGYLVQVQDITEDILRKKELEESVKKFQEIFDKANDGIVITDPSTKPGRFLEVNEVFCQRLGYSRDELRNLTPLDISTGEFSSPLNEIYEILEKDNSITFESVDLAKDGTCTPVEVNAHLVELQGKKVLLSISRDIRERKRLQQQLEENAYLLSQILRNMPVILYKLNKDGIFTRSEGAGLSRLGLKDHQALGMNVFEAWPEFTDIYRRALDGKTERFESQGEANGQMWSFLTYLFPDKTTGAGLIGFAMDLTEREQLRLQLVENEQRFRRIFQDGPLGMGAVDEKLNHLFVNEKYCEMLGYTQEELLSLTVPEITHPDDKHLDIELSHQLFEKNSDSFKISKRIIKKDNSICWVNLTATIIHDDDGNHLYGLGMIEDVSDLHQSEEKYRSLVERSNDGIVIVQGNDIEFLNYQLAQMLGYTVEELLHTSYVNILHPDVVEEIKDRREVRLAGEAVPSIYDSKLLKKDGSSLDVELNVGLVDYQGKQSFLVFIRDITERKEAMRLIKESEEKYRLIIETAQEGVLLVDKEARISFVNQRLIEMLGYSSENMINRTILDFLDSNDQNKAKLLFERKKHGLEGQFDFKFRRRDGTDFWGLINTNLILNEKGKFIGTLGMVIDITERKLMEETTRKQLMKFNVEEGEVYLITESSPIISVSVFEDLSKLGYQGLIISRTLEKDFIQNLNADCEFLWLAQNGKGKYIQPNLEKIKLELKKQHQKSLVLIDRLEYLIQMNNFKETLNFVYELKEIAYMLDLILLISVDPKIMTDHELLLLGKETKEIEPRSLVKIPDDMLELLRYVYHKNKLGIRPAYSDIGNEFQISRPTTRKRIKTLLATGYLNEYRFGIRKVLEVAEKGRGLFSD